MHSKAAFHRRGTELHPLRLVLGEEGDFILFLPNKSKYALAYRVHRSFISYPVAA